MPLIGTPMQRLLAASSTASAFALSGPGRVLLSDLSALGRIPLGSPTNRLRSVEILPFGTGADNSTFSARLYRLKHSAISGSRPVSGHLDYLGLLECTLGTGTLVAGDELLDAGEVLCDGLTWTQATAATTPKGLGATLETAHAATIAAFSPADNLAARLVIPDSFDGDELVLDFDLTGATAANALWTGYA